MTNTQAKQFVVVSLVASGGLAAVREITKGDAPDLRIGLGVVIAGVLLAGTAEFAPDVAGGLALVMLFTSVFVIGGDAWSGLSKSVGVKPATPVGEMEKGDLR